MEYMYGDDDWWERPDCGSFWSKADPDNVPWISDFRRLLAHQQGVIEALQANIAELTKPPPEVSLTPLVVDRRAVLTIGLYESKPAIPAQALKVAKLPRFF